MSSSSHVLFLPVFAVIWLFLTFLLSYSMAVWDGHVYPWLPYISETGTLPPESCLFGQMLNIGAALTGLIVYFRYMQAELLIKSKKLGKLCRLLNKGCLLSGICMAIGYSMVANFQATNLLAIHLVGAVLAFQVGIVYFVLQTGLSGVLNGGDKIGQKINILRTILCILAACLKVTMTIYAVKSFRFMHANNGKIQEAMLFGPNNPSYTDRLISTISEWGLSGCFGLYILTFAYDFKYLHNDIIFMDSRLHKIDERLRDFL